MTKKKNNPEIAEGLDEILHKYIEDDSDRQEALLDILGFLSG